MELHRVRRDLQAYVGARHVGPYHEIKEAFERLFPIAARHNIVMTGAPIAVYYDDPGKTPAEELQSDAAIPVHAIYDLEATQLHTFSIPAGEFIYTDYIGPYAGLGAAWEGFMQALDRSDFRDQLDYRWTFEEYLNDCSEVGEANAHTRLFCGLKS